MPEFYPRKITPNKKMVEVIVEEISIIFSPEQIKEALCEKYKNQLIGQEKFRLPDITNIHMLLGQAGAVFTWDKGK